MRHADDTRASFPLATGGRFGPRQWTTPLYLTPGFPNLDLAPDGKRFAVFPDVGNGGNAKTTSVHVTFLVNFLDELKRKLP
jgi:hypothetical protein